MDLLDPYQQFGVADPPGARVGGALAPAVERGDRNLQDLEDVLDPESLPVLLDEREDYRRIGSSCWAKKAEAALRMPLARLSSAFSRSNSALCARSISSSSCSSVAICDADLAGRPSGNSPRAF